MRYRFAGLDALVSADLSNGIWKLWQYKLDPYKIICDDALCPDLYVGQWDDRQSVPKPVSVLQKEQSGFFSHIVRAVNSGGYIYDYTRNVNDEEYIKYYVTESHSQVYLIQDRTESDGMMAFEYLTRIMPTVLLTHDILTFHGVLLEDEGRGIIISAPSGTGKTTHARLWRDTRNSLIINGDRVTCYVKDGGWIGCGLPWSGTSGEQINRSVPLTSMVVLERSKVNKAERLYGMDAFGAIFPNVLYPNWDAELTGKAMDLIDSFLMQIPVYRLSCRPDADSVRVLDMALRENK